MTRDRLTDLINGFGLLLLVIGIGAFLIGGAGSITALIPAFIGIPMLMAGFATSKPQYRRWGAYTAIGLALLMIIGSYRGITTFLSGLSGKGEISAAAWLQVVLVVLSCLFLFVSLRIALTRGNFRF